MATLQFRPSIVRASAIPNPSPSSDNARPKPSSAGSPSWWTPLFGYSPEPDYITAGSPQPEKPKPAEKASPPARFAPGCFTEEKAKRFRMLTKDMDLFHDVMYHSPIASRLASEFKDRLESDL